ncbi:hypothetical protein [Pseudoflavonifractor phocaeensis]|uniref:hypothetical protein n=1 Tax=Pseudoflavonifractor phocaeensis TaxID=1870988 RepID=UPI001F2332E2|nr:hypothetical protein [Pseudoflavonifractor phocaeensis]MCF2595730.1 hypothetical protein [Pseudoflavonifractor phocaeensis]
METLIFFIILPAASGLLQFFLTRSSTSRRVKCSPAVVTGVVSLTCFLGMTGWLPLPKTYYLSKPAFVQFPDFWTVWLFCFPILFGLGMGALFGVSDLTES